MAFYSWWALLAEVALQELTISSHLLFCRLEIFVVPCLRNAQRYGKSSLSWRLHILKVGS